MCATVSVDFPHWPLLGREKTNVGVDDVFEVNSSTLCVFGVEPPSDAAVPVTGYL